MNPVSSRLNRIRDNYFAHLEGRIAALQQAGHALIRLDVGSPDLPPAPHILNALAQAALRSDSHGYQTHSGPPELRQAWADMYAREHGVTLNPDAEILPLLGSKEGIFHLTQALVEPGDAVIVPDPGYQTYAAAAAFAGGEPYPLRLRPDCGYLPDLAAIPAAVLKRARLLWLNYPNNPTTATANPGFFSEAVAFAYQHNLLLCHDAAYTRVTFDGHRAPSILETPGAQEVAVEFNSLSKAYNIPGWRVGALAGHPQVVKALFRLKSSLDSSHFLPILEAAALALGGDQEWTVARNEIYRQRRDIVLKALAISGIRLPAPHATIYLWCPVPSGWSSTGFVETVLEQAHVSLTPGPVFGEGGEGYFRVSLTAPAEQLETAFARIAYVIEKPRRQPL